VMDGGRNLERTLHRRFADLRSEGEWFSPGPELLDYIASEADRWDGKNEVPNPIRLKNDAIRWARIACAYTGESITEYMSRVVIEQARKDIETGHARMHRIYG
jgi:hypothetical protein